MGAPGSRSELERGGTGPDVLDVPAGLERIAGQRQAAPDRVPLKLLEAVADVALSHQSPELDGGGPRNPPGVVQTKAHILDPVLFQEPGRELIGRDLPGAVAEVLAGGDLYVRAEAASPLPEPAAADAAVPPVGDLLAVRCV